MYEFDEEKDGWNFFFLDDVDVPFPKPPENNDDDGLLAASTDTGVRILRIRLNTGGGPRYDNNADASAFD